MYALVNNYATKLCDFYVRAKRLNMLFPGPRPELPIVFLEDS